VEIEPGPFLLHYNYSVEDCKMNAPISAIGPEIRRAK
jgi:hypothetical protein